MYNVHRCKTINPINKSISALLFSASLWISYLNYMKKINIIPHKQNLNFSLVLSYLLFNLKSIK